MDGAAGEIDADVAGEEDDEAVRRGVVLGDTGPRRVEDRVRPHQQLERERDRVGGREGGRNGGRKGGRGSPGREKEREMK